MAGQGTVGLDILEDVPHVTDIALEHWRRRFHWRSRHYAVKAAESLRLARTEGVPIACMFAEIAGRRRIVTLKRSLRRPHSGAPAPSERTGARAAVTPGAGHRSARQRGDPLASLPLLERLKVLAEPAASCTLAAAEKLQQQFSPDRHVVLVLCGGNALNCWRLSYSPLCCSSFATRAVQPVWWLAPIPAPLSP